MNRTALLTAICTAAAVGGVTIAAAQSDEPSVPLIAAGASADHEAAVEDDLEPAGSTTTSIEVPASTTTEAPTTTVTAAPSTSTTARPATTTTAPAAPQVRPLGLRCAGSGDAKTGNAKPGDSESGAWVYCEVDGVHERASHLVLTRDGEPIARTDKNGGTSFKDREVRPGQTYSYQAHSYTADGTLLQSSDAIRATAGPEGERDDGPLALRCAGTGDGDKTGRAKPGDREAAPVVHCKAKGWPERAAYLVLTRDGEPIARSDDRSVTTYEDWEVRPGGTYVYQVHAHGADGALLESSERVQAHS